MKVLLVNPRQRFDEGNIWKSVMGCVPPLGIAQIAAYLSENNISVRIIDANAEGIDGSALAARIRAETAAYGVPEYTGVTSTTNTFFQALEAGKILKEVLPGSLLAAGGVHATILPEDFLKYAYFDLCVRGEGEIPFFELLSGKDKTSVASVSYRSESGEFVHNPAGGVFEDLDALPMPAYSLLPMSRYRPSLGSYKALPAVGMVTSRGCPGRCTFCYGQFFGKKIRFRSAGTIINEIRHLKNTYGIREISFYDDTLTAARPNLVKFCETAASEGLGVIWSCFSRADLITADLLALMKKAGCHQICYGIESGDEGILKNIGKNISPDTAKKAVRLTKEAGIEARATFMLGNPGETQETMRKTYRFALELDPDIALFNITTPFPGTEMFDWADRNGYLKTRNWADYDLSKTVMQIPGLNGDEIKRCHRAFNRGFYLRPAFLLKRLFSLTSFSQVTENLSAVRAVLSK